MYRCTVCTANRMYSRLQESQRGPVSSNLEKTPSMVNGKEERFRDVHALVREWEELESCKEEWEVQGGVRRGGRKVSKRMSELLGRFGEWGRGLISDERGPERCPR